VLVEHLDDDTLAIRVLSFWNLKNVFGLGLQYRPEDPAAKRRTPSQKWKQRLESGELWAKMAAKKKKKPNGEKASPPGAVQP